MSNYYSDPTANAVIGTVDKEIKRMRKKAQWIRALRLNGCLTKSDIAQAKREFKGIHRHLLHYALGEEKTPEPNGSGVSVFCGLNHFAQ